MEVIKYAFLSLVTPYNNNQIRLRMIATIAIETRVTDLY